MGVDQAFLCLRILLIKLKTASLFIIKCPILTDLIRSSPHTQYCQVPWSKSIGHVIRMWTHKARASSLTK